MTDDLVAARQEKHYSMLHRTTLMCTTRYQMKAERGKYRTVNLIYPNRNGMVWYLAVSIHTLGPVHWGGGGGVLAVKVCKIWTNSIMLPTVTMMNSEHVKKVFLKTKQKKLYPEH